MGMGLLGPSMPCSITMLGLVHWIWGSCGGMGSCRLGPGGCPMGTMLLPEPATFSPARRLMSAARALEVSLRPPCSAGSTRECLQRADCADGSCHVARHIPGLELLAANRAANLSVQELEAPSCTGHC